MSIVRKVKAHWSQVEELVANDEIIEVLNWGKPRGRLVLAGGRQRVIWNMKRVYFVNPSGVAMPLLPRL
jgi:hypothetical protein